jgi:hypothetical protein
MTRNTPLVLPASTDHRFSPVTRYRATHARNLTNMPLRFGSISGAGSASVAWRRLCLRHGERRSGPSLEAPIEALFLDQHQKEIIKVAAGPAG